MRDTIFTIGHSTHPANRFIDLLQQHGITALCDVRSKPFSRTNPQFNRKGIEESLRESGIRYVFLGRELGARSDDPACYDSGKIQYEWLARTELFLQGIERVQDGMTKGYRLVLMCAEKEPLACHRTILIARHIAALGIRVQHIHADGTLESHEDALNRLARQLNLPEYDMFRSRDEVLADAYRLQEARIAFDRGRAQPQREGPNIRSASG